MLDLGYLERRSMGMEMVTAMVFGSEENVWKRGLVGRDHTGAWLRRPTRYVYE